MAATFDPTLPTAKDRIRQRIGDTDVTAARIQDETIAAYLAGNLSELGVARQLCLDLAAYYAGLGDSNIDNQMSRNSQIYTHYINLAGQIAREIGAPAGGGAMSGAIFVGGLTETRSVTFDPQLDCPWP